MFKVVPFTIEPSHRRTLWGLGLDTLESCLHFDGGTLIKSNRLGRDVRRVDRPGSTYFLKRVRGTGYSEILNECRVLNRLKTSGLPVAEPVAVGADGRAAVLLTVGLPVTTSLEHIALDHGDDRARVERLLRQAGTLLQNLHRCGVNHRDFYAGHLLADDDDRLFLIDLGRAEMRRRVPYRRRVKDLAALTASLPPRLAADGNRIFLDAYLGSEHRPTRKRRLFAAMERKGRRMRRHAERQVARGAANFHVND